MDTATSGKGMTTYTIPNKASDAGPECRPEPPKDYTDWLFESEDLLRDARVLRRDDLAAQRKLQREALLAAREAIDAALRLIPEVR